MANMVNIFLFGKQYQVPDDLTIMRAMEYAGYQLVRGCGCRNGFCGACATIYRIKGDRELKTCLACQTKVEDNMYVATLPFFPLVKQVYDIETIKPTEQIMMQLYPEIYACVGCNACTKSCTQKLNVMQYIAYAQRGEFDDDAHDLEEHQRRHVDHGGHRFTALAQHGQRTAKQHRKQQHLQHVTRGKRVDHRGRDQPHQEVHRAATGQLVGIAGVSAHGRGIELARVHIHACTRLEHKGQHQAQHRAGTSGQRLGKQRVAGKVRHAAGSRHRQSGRAGVQIKTFYKTMRRRQATTIIA